MEVVFYLLVCASLAVGLLKHTASSGVGTADCKLKVLRQILRWCSFVWAGQSRQKGVWTYPGLMLLGLSSNQSSPQSNKTVREEEGQGVAIEHKAAFITIHCLKQMAREQDRETPNIPFNNKLATSVKPHRKEHAGAYYTWNSRQVRRECVLR